MRVIEPRVVAARCGLSQNQYRVLMDQGIIAKPDVISDGDGVWKRYSEDLANRTSQEFLAKYGRLYRVSHVAKEIGVGVSFVQKMIQKKLIPPPSLKILASYHYTESEAEEVRKKVQHAKDTGWGKKSAEAISKISSERANKRYERRRQLGFYSMADIARMNKVSQISVSYCVDLGYIPSPTHEVDGHFGRYYNVYESKNLAKFFAGRAKKARKRT